MRVSLVVLADPPPSRPEAALHPDGRGSVPLGDGRTALDHLLGRMVATRAHDVVLLTDPEATIEPERRPGLRIVRGQAPGLATRVLEAATRPRTTAVVLVDLTGPLLDPALVDRVIDEHGCNLSAVVSTERPRTLPRGQSVELLPMAVLRRLAADELAAPEDADRASRADLSLPAPDGDLAPRTGPAARCTAPLHAAPASVTWRPIAIDPERAEHRLGLETDADARTLRALIAALGPNAPAVGWRELLRREPAARRAAETSAAPSVADGSTPAQLLTAAA